MAKRRNKKQELQALLPRGWWASRKDEARWVPSGERGAAQRGYEYRIIQEGAWGGSWLIWLFEPGKETGSSVKVSELPASAAEKTWPKEAPSKAARFNHAWKAAEAAEEHWESRGGKQQSPNRKHKMGLRRNAEEGLRRASVGKFEGGLEIDNLIHGLSLDGGCEELGDVEDFGHYCIVPLDDVDAVKDVEREARSQGGSLTEEERELIRDSAGAILFTNSQGFVDVTYFDTKRELDSTWADLEKQYEDYLEEFGEEEENY